MALFSHIISSKILDQEIFTCDQREHHAFFHLILNEKPEMFDDVILLLLPSALLFLLKLVN